MKKAIQSFFLSIFLFCPGPGFPQSRDTLWYSNPARFFEDALVLGNGKMGATVFGGVAEDKIWLNDTTLWAGEPVNPDMNPEAHTFIPAIREALKKGDYELADKLNRKVQGSFSQSYAPLGTLFLRFAHEEDMESYRRELNIAEAVSKVAYVSDGITFTREYFVSHPDRILVIRLMSGERGALNFKIGFESLLKYKTASEENILRINGYAPYHAEPRYRGDIPDAFRFDKNRGTRFTTLISINNTDGRVISTDSGLELTGGTEAVVLVSIATSFNGFDKDPAKEGLDNEAIAASQLKRALEKDYSDLKSAHINDFLSFFGRVDLDLGETGAPELPTDERLKRYAEGQEDKNLEILYFQFGRYLLISSSRTLGVPANLQGIWNPYLRPPWSSNYTMNINVEENYWLAETTNLSEMHRPLLTFIGNLAKTGAVTARNFYGAGGWAACHNSDIWAMSNPVGDFGQGHPVWANWNMSGAWLVTHLWEHYLFSMDEMFLKEKAYPLMKGAARFCLEWLVEDEKGHLITSPSTSPENLYLTPDGYRGATLSGGTADLAMIRECFLQTVRAAEVLQVDAEFRSQLETALSRLHPYQVGRKGNLQEWYFDWEDADPKHRHQSHLFGLHPGHHITPAGTPELAAACRRTLEIKGDETTGWSKGWRINLWARLLDGNRAYKMYRELLRYVPPDGLDANYSGGGGTYPNLLDAHPPFQIDGNFGGTAAVAEMLIQSTENEIRLLPALPDAWPTGSFKGLRARGGFELSVLWKDKKPVRITIKSEKGGRTTLAFGNEKKDIILKARDSVTINWSKLL
ncbi:MAG: glycoside hydrolase family 95 protein [Candidatus Aminicenantes bacterium]|nr:glycoside hydrolase family 95 protein [Candidatus Aminicenantes bacterium]